jgi:hypothetical protein
LIGPQEFPVESERPFRLPRTLEILLGLVVVLELIAPFTPKSYGLDGGSHLNWIHQFSDLFTNGVLVPRWAPTAFGGFGAATFYFYPPLTFYIASVIRVVSGIALPTVLFQLTGLAGTIASFLTCRAFLKSLWKVTYQANVGALLYTCAPLRIFDLYNRCSLSTHIAYIFFPLVWMGLVAVQRLSEADNYQWRQLIKPVLLFAISSALLALTSVPLAIVTMMCIVVAAFVCWKWVTLRGILATILGGVIALGLVSFHFSASLAGRSYVWLKEIEVLYPSASLSAMLHNLGSPEVYNLILLCVAIIFIAVGLWKVLRERKSSEIHSLKVNDEISIAKIGLAIAILFIFLDSHYSLPLWNRLLPLQLVQFASRFWSQLVLGIAVLVGLARTRAMQRAARQIVWLWVLGAIAPAILIAFNIHLNAHAESPVNDALEYRPIYTMPREKFVESIEWHAADPAAISELSPGEYVRPLTTHPQPSEFSANLTAPRLVTFHRFFWPYWHLYVNGTEQQTWPDSIGRAATILPQGALALQWRLEPSPLERAGVWVSGLTVLLIVAIGGVISWCMKLRKIQTE